MKNLSSTHRADTLADFPLGKDFGFDSASSHTTANVMDSRKTVAALRELEKLHGKAS